MKKKIWKKLFAITSASLILFITVTIYLQSIFFEDFYVNRKIKRFEQNVEQFNGLYTQNYINSGNLYRMMRQFEESNNAKIIIIGSTGEIKYIGDSKIDMDSSKVNTINKIFKEWISNPSTFNKILKLKTTQTYIYHNTDFDIQNIVCLSPLSTTGDSDVILAVSSLQPVEEAADIIKEFYIYVFFGAVLVIVILSLIYANMISKPLRQLNNTAVKIAEMDFSKKCEVNSEDEIGSLASTLNFLSQRLDKALSELREKNIALQKDIEKERKLDRMRKDFIAGVSHELRTPISIISGYAEGLKDNIADDESREFYLDVIMDEAAKMNALVSDMLDLSQLESGTFKLTPRELCIDELIRKCISKHMQFMQQKNINLITNISENAYVFGDYIRIEQVLTNFITNAVRHTNEGCYIEIRLFADGDYYIVEVENQGEKIPEHELESIWDKFYKVDKSRNRSVGGIGLGLSIVKNILLLHNSTFGVRNTEKGVCFYFSLRKINPTKEE
ncbi:sensor histidine kinase [Clostridium thermarum]|uniref:sensor histidine kinase n=1 Tax=Clostridium thermarum TaxID=1716543 RepID=UPI0013D2FB63|nr:HAMP domain-containing sensor histidine kinase [Clostridium thermarum]